MFDRLFEPAASEIHIPIDSLRRRFRVQLEWQPCHPDEVLLLELFDSDRVDVAPGSNVVGEDDEVDRVGCASHLLRHNRESHEAIPGAAGAFSPAKAGILPGTALSHSELRAIRLVFLRLSFEYPFGENQL
jgi:hypothetical protein